MSLHTIPLYLWVGDHLETIQFYVIKSPEFPLILGFTWLVLHNPQIDWSSSNILKWRPDCDKCLSASSLGLPVYPELLQATPGLLMTTLQFPRTFPELSRVPPHYADLLEVFSKKEASSLPLHRPYDCAIDLLSGTCPPRGRLFSLSSPEREAMDDYIQESLASGFIRPSTSPAETGFFFVAKKDSGLQPCIDYRGLNKTTIKNRYPLPLMSTAFELLQGATIFTKLDLRNAYHLVHIRTGDERRTAFNTPNGHYEYQVAPFGLVNAPEVFQALINDVLKKHS